MRARRRTEGLHLAWDGGACLCGQRQRAGGAGQCGRTSRSRDERAGESSRGHVGSPSEEFSEEPYDKFSDELSDELSDEHGAGTVLAVGVIGVLLVLSLGVVGLVQAQSASGRARAAADLSALAGATVLGSVAAPGDPCLTARRVAQANGAVMGECTVTGEDVTVSVAVSAVVLGVSRQAVVQARAGPEEEVPVAEPGGEVRVAEPGGEVPVAEPGGEAAAS